MSSPTPKTPASLQPISREGSAVSTGAAVILHLLLLLSTALVGVGIAAMRTTSPAEVRVAEICAGVCMLLLVLYVWRAARTARGMVLLTAAVAWFLCYTTHSLIPAGVLCGLLFAVGAGGFLLAVLPAGRLKLIPLIPLLAYALTAALSRDLVGSAAVLIPYPPMIALALGTRACAADEEGPTRTGVIAGTSLALGLSMGAMVLLSAIRETGTADVTLLIDNARQAAMDFLLSAEIPPELPPETREGLRELFSYGNVENLVNSTFNLLPALYASAVMAMVTVSQSLILGLLRTFGWEASITPRVRDFRMSTVSCVVFLAAYLFVWLDRSTFSSLAGVVLQNIYVMLLPGLAVAGTVRAWTGLTRKGARGLGCLFYLVILIPCLLVTVPIIPAAVEVIGNLFSAITAKLKPPEENGD